MERHQPWNGVNMGTSNSCQTGLIGRVHAWAVKSLWKLTTDDEHVQQNTHCTSFVWRGAIICADLRYIVLTAKVRHILLNLVKHVIKSTVHQRSCRLFKTVEVSCAATNISNIQLTSQLNTVNACRRGISGFQRHTYLTAQQSNRKQGSIQIIIFILLHTVHEPMKFIDLLHLAGSFLHSGLLWDAGVTVWPEMVQPWHNRCLPSSRNTNARPPDGSSMTSHSNFLEPATSTLRSKLLRAASAEIAAGISECQGLRSTYF